MSLILVATGFGAPDSSRWWSAVSAWGQRRLQLRMDGPDPVRGSATGRYSASHCARSTKTLVSPRESAGLASMAGGDVPRVAHDRDRHGSAPFGLRPADRPRTRRHQTAIRTVPNAWIAIAAANATRNAPGPLLPTRSRTPPMARGAQDRGDEAGAVDDTGGRAADRRAVVVAREQEARSTTPADRRPSRATSTVTTRLARVVAAGRQQRHPGRRRSRRSSPNAIGTRRIGRARDERADPEADGDRDQHAHQQHLARGRVAEADGDQERQPPQRGERRLRSTCRRSAPRSPAGCPASARPADATADERLGRRRARAGRRRDRSRPRGHHAGDGDPGEHRDRRR